MSVAIANMTAEELLALPRGRGRYELVKGALREMSPAGHAHGKVAARLTSRLESFVEAGELGLVFAAETGFFLARNPDTVRAPDVAFVSRERSATASQEGYFPGAPDLAIEVVSPNDSFSSVEEKVFEWLDSGCRAVVVVDPRRKATSVYRSRQSVTVLGEDDVLAVEDVLPGWSVSLKPIFK